MAIRKSILGLGLALFVAGTALAARHYVAIEQRLSPAQMHDTGLDTLSAAQLSRLNAVLEGEAEVEAATAPTPRPAGERGAMSYIGMDTERISTRLQGSVGGWEPGTEFHLANGQVWKVLKGSMKLRHVLASPEVVLVPGVMGRWFLQIDEDAPKARVYRID
jgi:hypothetical protein